MITLLLQLLRLLPFLCGGHRQLSPGSHASRARQGCAGRQARRAPRGGQADRGSPHGAAQPVAESFRRAPHRFDPARVSESRSRSRRKAPPPHPGATSSTITGVAFISRLTRMRRTSGPSSAPRRAGSWRFPKSVAASSLQPGQLQVSRSSRATAALAESCLTSTLFRQILWRVERLRWHPM